jgi:hypothetical protein
MPKTRKIRWGAVLALLALAALLAIAPAAVAKKQRGAYWGAWIGSQLTGGQPPWDMTAVTGFESLATKGLSLLEFSGPFTECDAAGCEPYLFPDYEVSTIRNYGAIPVFSWGSQPTPVPVGLVDPNYQLTDIAAGAFDGYLRQFAEEARTWGHPFFLRFNWEMNGNWFLWSEGVNGNPRGSYVAAWRHVHDIFTAVGATNADWLWCPYADPSRRLPPMSRFYPGDAYVDWTCLDGYNWAGAVVNPQPWAGFDQIFRPSYEELIHSIAPKKPVMLGEMASGGGGARKALWITDMFRQLRTNYRRVRALIWFDQVDRGVQWPIETSPLIVKAFARGVRQAGFKHNRYGNIEGPIPIPR